MNMADAIVPKSDQINADDLIGRTMTITIRDVKIVGGQEQPVSIYFEGSDKAFRPCKSMSRVLVAAWGADAKEYIGRSLTLYRDPTVKWGGLEVGGIRISHMSDIDAQMTMALTATRGNRKPYTVKPLTAPIAKSDKAADGTRELVDRIGAVSDSPALAAIVDDATVIKQREYLAGKRPELAAEVDTAVAEALQRIEQNAPKPETPTEEDEFPTATEPSPATAELPGEAVPATEEADVAAAPQQGETKTLFERQAERAGFKPEGPADEDRGEKPTLEDAKAAVDKAAAEEGTIAAVNGIVASFRGQLSVEDETKLSSHAMNVIAGLPEEVK